MADRIKQRRDTKDNWNTSNPVLLDGEIGIETDTRKMKFGDGSNHWNNLKYVIGQYCEEIYRYDGVNAIHGQGGNLFDSTVWNTLSGVDLSVYKSVRIYVNPSKHSVGLSSNNITSAVLFDIELDDMSKTADITCYSGSVIAGCVNNDNRLYAVTALIRKNGNDWQIALKTVSLYGTSSTDISDSYIYKIEGVL